jgi:thioesterase domain-containing protein
MPGVVGEIMRYAPLLHHLPVRQPVYAFEDRSTEYISDSVIQIESLASRYLAAIREVQPEGPYHLAGYSVGGVTAFEIAMQIRAQGERVGVLAIIDGDAPPSVRPPAGYTPNTVAKFVTNLAYLVADDVLKSSATDLHERFESKFRLLVHSLKGADPKDGKDRGGADIRDIAAMPCLQEHLKPRLEAFLSAISRYRPGYYDGRLTLLRARTFGLFQTIAHDRGWGAVAADIDVRVLKGNHNSILREPLVRQLATELEELLGLERNLAYRSS